VSSAKVRQVDPLLVLLGNDSERASEFVHCELGPVIDTLGPRADRLLDTLQAFLDHGQRIANASAVTGRHRDTVHRHLREMEVLLDCRVEERSAELQWALRLRLGLQDRDDSAG
jgi:DNA-binding PucR family transcriptional regulator